MMFPLSEFRPPTHPIPGLSVPTCPPLLHPVFRVEPSSTLPHSMTFLQWSLYLSWWFQIKFFFPCFNKCHWLIRRMNLYQVFATCFTMCSLPWICGPLYDKGWVTHGYLCLLSRCLFMEAMLVIALELAVATHSLPGWVRGWHTWPRLGQLDFFSQKF
jgi:hypothetical protein